MADAQPRLLVVDDEVDTCANLSDILTDLGYRGRHRPRRSERPGTGRGKPTTWPCWT